MGRDYDRDDKRRDRRYRNRSRDRLKDRRRSRSRSPGHGRSSAQHRDRSRERNREDYRRDSRHEHSDRRRDKNRIKNTSPKKNKFLERAQKLGISTGIPTVDGPTSSQPTIPLNPLSTSRIVDQIKQRKLLWSQPPENAEDTDSPQSAAKSDKNLEHSRPGSVQHWAKATFRGDDGSMSAKFRKLMGMKDTDAKAGPMESQEVLAEQDKLFRQLDQEYQKARQSTHTQRGMGLGWGH